MKTMNFLHLQRMARRTAQRGIGLAGFIVGIVVGLAVALAVAVYITKIPTPFNDKTGLRTAEQQAADDAKHKNWDPNAGLQGKRAQGASTGGSVDNGATTPPQTPASQPPAIVNQLDQPPVKKPAGKPSAPPAADPSANHPEVLGDREQELAKARQDAEAKLKADLKTQEQARAKAREEARARAKVEADKANASADPIGSLVQSRSQPPAAEKPQVVAKEAAPAAASEPFVYFVQAGAFRESAEADAQKARLSLMGLNARVTERDQAGRAVYRVRLGPFNSKAEADSAKARLDNNGVDAALVRVQR